MKKHGKFFTANIVLGVIFAIIVVIDILLVVMFQPIFEEIEEEYTLKDLLEDENFEDENFDEEYFNDYGFNRWYTMISVGEINAEPIGEVYGNQTAEEGYEYYQINISIKNEGNNYDDISYLSLWFQGESYDEVNEVAEEDDSEMAYYNHEILPPGQTATANKVIEVKKGVTSVEMVFYNGEEQETYTINLE